MKYIRTKDGRILIAPDLYDNGGFFLASDPPMYETRNVKNECGYVFCHDVIKQADTIEDLCDSEVIVWNDSTPSTWNKFLTKQEFEHLYSSFQRKKVIAIYGAIWTDKGLIYVAKMNDEGELELL